jgi:hypothetical protein
MLQEGMKISLEKYNDGYLPEIKDENNIVDINIDIDDDNDNEEDNKHETIEEKEITIEEPKKENKETFSQADRNDIEEFLNILE